MTYIWKRTHRKILSDSPTFGWCLHWSNGTMFWSRNSKFVRRVVCVQNVCYSNRTDFNLLLPWKRRKIKIIGGCQAHHRLKGALQINIRKRKVQWQWRSGTVCVCCRLLQQRPWESKSWSQMKETASSVLGLRWLTLSIDWHGQKKDQEWKQSFEVPLP